jgi:hypothetical protein
MPLAKLARTEALAARFEFLASTSAPVGALSLMGLAGQLYLFKVSFRSKSALCYGGNYDFLSVITV